MQAKRAMRMKDFSSSVMNLPDLGNTRIGLLRPLFDQAKRLERKYVHGRYMEPNVIRLPQLGLEECSVTPHVVFLSHSYFTLAQQIHASKGWTDAHTPRPLMQTHFGLSDSSKRDGKQVYRLHKEEDAQDKLLFVPQIWAVMMDNGIDPH